VFHQCLIFATLIVQSVTDSWLYPEMRGFLGLESSVLDDTQDAASPNQVMHTIWWGERLISLVASAGLIFFRRWGRRLFVVVSAVSVLLTPFGGLYVDVGWTVLVGSVAGIIEGMIIALMYFSPLRKMFRWRREI
jgi:hypothetical protein